MKGTRSQPSSDPNAIVSDGADSVPQSLSMLYQTPGDDRVYFLDDFDNKVYLCDPENLMWAALMDPIDWFMESFPNLSVQSGSEEATETLKTQIVTFSESDPGHHSFVESAPDPSFWGSVPSDDSLASFLARPVQIQQYTITPGSAFTIPIFNPWGLFFADKRVVNRINNFRQIRCKLHLRVLISGTKFHYGRLLMSYFPLSSLSSTPGTSSLLPRYAIQESQRPHLWLNPCESVGGDMTLPFFWYKDAMDVPVGDWNGAGTITLRDVIPIKHANGTLDPVEITIYAWAEDVVLSIPTSVAASGLVPQGGNEYSMGPVSRPATALASIMGTLATIPAIRPYALASQMIASGVAGMAAALGYSRPTVPANQVQMIPKFVSTSAAYNAGDMAVTLAADIKNEVTIDPRVMGLGSVDEMSIAHVCAIESFLTTVPVLLSYTSGTVLFQSNITPFLFDVQPEGSGIHMTPMCVVASMFRMWRGTLRFRFQFATSSFHRGKIVIYYDPKSAASSTALSSNTNYTHIVDLAQTTDFCIDINWCANTSYLHTGIEPFNPPHWSKGVLSPVLLDDFCNGILSVAVLNQITCANSTVNNDTNFAVSVSMHQAEFASPDSQNFEPLSQFVAQSGLESCAEGACTPSDPPVLASFGDSGLSEVDIIYTGEKIYSLRSVIKRYSFLSALFPTVGISRYYFWNLLGFRGWDPSGFSLAVSSTTPKPYNFFSNTPLHFILPCFAGYRGSTRHKFIVEAPTASSIPNPFIISVCRNPTVIADGLLVNAAPTSTPSAGPASRVIGLDSTPSGAEIAIGPTQPVLEIHLPYQSIYRFGPGRSYNIGYSSSFFKQQLLLTFIQRTFFTLPATVNHYFAAGDDFNMGFWVGMPVVYRYLNPVASGS